MRIMTFQLIFFSLSTLLAPLEAWTSLSADGLRQGEPSFLVYLAGPDGGPVASPGLVPGSGSGSASWPDSVFGSAAYADFKAVIHYGNGSASPAFTGFPIPEDRSLGEGNYWDFVSIEGLAFPMHARRDIAVGAVMFLLGVPVDAPVGSAVIAVIDRYGNTAAEFITQVAKRDFRRDDIRLNQALTSLRVDPDPKKDEQARRYLALLAFVNPGARYLEQGFIRPVAGERRTSLFGDVRRYIYADNGTAWSIHNGVDYGYPTGTPVWAAGRGRVALAEDRIVTGNTVVIEHLPGVYTIYMHLHQMVVQVGDLVEREQAIGTIGATGLATGPHLHWELRISGLACDPEILAGVDKMPRIRTMTTAIEGR
jgi:murein DD-endopeptidase MepM/ murein hydrolase activator NlpD